MDELADFVRARLEEELHVPGLERHRERELDNLRAVVQRARAMQADPELAEAFVIVLRGIALRYATHPAYRSEWKLGRRPLSH